MLTMYSVPTAGMHIPALRLCRRAARMYRLAAGMKKMTDKTPVYVRLLYLICFKCQITACIICYI